jgi:hypothetical protein
MTKLLIIHHNGACFIDYTNFYSHKFGLSQHYSYKSGKNICYHCANFYNCKIGKSVKV